MNEKIVFITKDVLTRGIQEVKAEIYKDGSANYRSPSRRGHWSSEHASHVDVHVTREDAVARAELMRLRKIQALEKSAEKIRALKF